MTYILKNVHQKIYETSSTNNRHVMNLFFILQFMLLEFNVEHSQVTSACKSKIHTVMIAYSTLCKKTHIATNIILKEGYIIGFNLLNGANMTLWVKDLQYSAYTNMARYDTISQVMLPVWIVYVFNFN